MPEPISSSSSIPWTPSDEELVSEVPPEAQNVCQDPNDGAGGPLADYLDAPTPPTNNNAQRTTARQSSSAYAEAGLTSSSDSVFAGAAGIKTHDSASETDVEVFSGSIQLGAQNEAQVAMARVADTEGQLVGGVDVFTARTQLGIHNDDGSTGLNAGLSAAALGVEGTYTFDGGDSLTLGAAASVGLSGSIGLRDADGDGIDELCARFSGVIFTVGACLED